MDNHILYNLEGVTILVGREKDKHNLCVAIKSDKGVRAKTIGAPECVPGCVSRVTGTAAHCSIEIGKDWSLTLTNLKPQNKTYVNGMEIMSKRINPDNKVALGIDMYPISIEEVLTTANTLVPQKPKKINIYPLSYVWEEFEERKRAIQKKQQALINLRSFSPILTIGSGAFASLLSFTDMGDKMGGDAVKIISFVMTGIGLLLMIYAFIASTRANFQGKMQALNDEFMDRYSCPSCGRFMGNQPYKILRQNKKCHGCAGELYEEPGFQPC